jgi:hypothetical protein
MKLFAVDHSTAFNLVSTFARPAAVLAFALALAGCGSNGRLPTYPVSGELTINGAPAKGCVVTFVPADPALSGVVLPTGKVTDSGKFELTTYETGDGAPAGDYGVTLLWEATKWAGKDPDRGVDPVVTVRPDRLLDKYASPAQSQLKAKVVAGKNDLEPFRLTGVQLLKGSE